MAKRRTLVRAEYLTIVKAAKNHKSQHAWSAVCEELPGLHPNTIYAVLSAAGIIRSRDQVRSVNRQSVTRMLEESGSRNTTPWVLK